MNQAKDAQLISYIALSAPATRRPANGDEPFLRPEIGFTPRWFCKNLDIDFGQQWHINPAYRRDSLAAMGQEVKHRFGAIPIGYGGDPANPRDLLTGTFGACCIAAIYGIEIVYAQDNWPNCAHQYLTDDETERLEPPDLDTNPFFTDLMKQVDWIAETIGSIEGYINWQGVLNNAQRLRGEDLFVDMALYPQRATRLFDCVTQTMIDAATRLYERQRETGVNVRHFTVSNCLVNMVSPQQYRELLMPFDCKLSETFGLLGIHNCAWNADPYIEDYASIPNVAYIDMGQESDLARAKDLMPNARRAVMYTPMDARQKDLEEIKTDLERIARDYGPCDIVFADNDADTPDSRIQELVGLCHQITKHYQSC